MDYSPFVGGHYFMNLKCLANFDGQYKTGSQRKQLKLALVFADDFISGLEKLSRLYQAPIAFYDKSYAFNGQGQIKIFGQCDRIDYITDGEVIKSEKVVGDTYNYSSVYGKINLVPYYKGKKGLDCSVFGYGDMFNDAKKANDAIVEYNGEKNLGNLCECQFWVCAMMKYMLKFGRNESYDKKLQEFFKILLPETEEKAIVRLSVLKDKNNGFTTNFAKFDQNGQAKAVYHMDYIGGGGFQFEKNEIKYEILSRYPKTIDVKTSRYVYARAYDTIFTLTQEQIIKE